MKVNMTEFQVFFDGGCPLCSREINFLQKLDTEKKIIFTDISDPNFVPSEYGLTFDDFMAQIRGRLPNGSMVTGVEVFRHLYSAVGLKWAVAVSRWPVVRQALDLGYELFANNRLRLTGRCNLNKGCE